MAGQDWLEKDFYALLGVAKDASAADIKKAYRKKARTLHPDANHGDAQAEQQFKAVGEAYSILSDAEQRQQYDAVRAMAGGGARFTSGGAGGGAGGFEDLLGGLFGGSAGSGGASGAGQRVRFDTGGRGSSAGAGVPPGFEDLLSGMFASGGGGYDSYGATRAPQRGADVSASTTIDLVTAVEGSTTTLRAADGQQVTVRIPAGVRDGQKIRLRGRGRAGDVGSPAGDLVIMVTVTKHPVFSRTGDDLRITLPVSFAEAVLGAEVQCPTVDGATVRLKVPAGTPSGRTLRVKGRGVTTSKATGDLLVTVQVVVPQRLDDVARSAVEAFREATSAEDPRADLAARIAGAR